MLLGRHGLCSLQIARTASASASSHAWSLPVRRDATAPTPQRGFRSNFALLRDSVAHAKCKEQQQQQHPQHQSAAHLLQGQPDQLSDTTSAKDLNQRVEMVRPPHPYPSTRARSPPNRPIWVPILDPRPICTGAQPRQSSSPDLQPLHRIRWAPSVARYRYVQCTNMRIGMRSGMCADTYIDMRADMYVGMCKDTCVDMRIDM